MPDLVWALFGLAIWFGFGFRGIKNIKLLADFNASRNGKKEWTSEVEFWGRLAIIGGMVIWAVSKMTQASAKGYWGGFSSWFSLSTKDKSRRRVAACLYACEGIPTETIERYAECGICTQLDQHMRHEEIAK